jgi:hypothetical protein
MKEWKQVPQGSVFVPLLFLAYLKDIWKGIDSNIQLFYIKAIPVAGLGGL